MRSLSATQHAPLSTDPPGGPHLGYAVPCRLIPRSMLDTRSHAHVTCIYKRSFCMAIYRAAFY